jgi:steroid delta-isomerase
MSPEIIARGIKAYFAATRMMNAESWLDTFAPDAVSYDPVGAPPTVGHEALGHFFAAILGAFKEVGLTEEHVFIVGNEAAVKWSGRGTGRTAAMSGSRALTSSSSTKRARSRPSGHTGTRLK